MSSLSLPFVLTPDRRSSILEEFDLNKYSA